jgi:hypothetical protein
MSGRLTQGIGPELKPQYHKKTQQQGKVVHAWYPSYLGGTGRRMEV